MKIFSNRRFISSPAKIVSYSKLMKWSERKIIASAIVWLALSENIHVRSIVGRFLEHPRILYFKHGGGNVYFMTSADMMPRNLDRRVELKVEITDPDMKASMENFLSVSLTDNKKAWELHDDKYAKIMPADGEKEVNSQIYFLENEI